MAQGTVLLVDILQRWRNLLRYVEIHLLCWDSMCNRGLYMKKGYYITFLNCNFSASVVRFYLFISCVVKFFCIYCWRATSPIAFVKWHAFNLLNCWKDLCYSHGLCWVLETHILMYRFAFCVSWTWFMRTLLISATVLSSWKI